MVTTNIDIDSYEQTHQQSYAEFANAVRRILKSAIDANRIEPRPQSTKARAKTATSLRQKLLDRGMIASTQIENEIKDLAGIRLIFYTDSDVNAFLHTGLIPQVFEVHWDETRIHHPTDENQLQRYQAIHYTISLKESEFSQPEYQKFKGMRCEVQIQTILSHAWAEIYHDMIYKQRGSKGFGSAKLKALDRRMKRIMDEYLRPAGYELQKAQADYKRLVEGRDLFDRDAFALLANSKNNNDREEILTTIADHLVPNYDDLASVYPRLRAAVLACVRAAQKAPVVPFEFAGGTIDGRTVRDVTGVAINILDGLRYVDIGSTLQAWIELYRGTDDPDTQTKIADAAKRLAEYNLSIWKRAGPGVQQVLAQILEQDRTIPRPIVLAVAGELLGTTLEATYFSADKATIRTAALPAPASIAKIRSSVLDVLVALFDSVSSDQERREVFAAMQEATSLPSRSVYTNELCRVVLEDTKRLVGFCATRAALLSYEFLQYLEHRLLFQYRRARDLARDMESKFGCQDIAAEVVSAIRSLRDTINADADFVRYKTLVGHESVFSFQWDDEKFSYSKSNDHRLKQVENYVKAITGENADQWYRVIQRCAATRSNDLATFPVFETFLHSLSAVKPEIATSFFDRGDADLAVFLAAYLNGVAKSSAPELYRAVLRKNLDKCHNLSAIVRHARSLRGAGAQTVIDVLQRAIATDNAPAVQACVPYAIENHANGEALAQDVFMSALQYLETKRTAGWIFDAWFLSEADSFFRALSAEHAELVLTNLLWLKRVDHHAEGILKSIAQSHLRAVWHFLRDRVRREEDGYEAIPYEFHTLSEVLACNVDLALEVLKAWHDDGDSNLFEFTGGRLLHAALPEFTEELGRELAKLVRGGLRNTKFVVSVLGRYEGATLTHVVLKDLVEVLPEAHALLPTVENLIETTGVLSGEYGFVEAYRKKKADMFEWLCDDRAKVRQFAERYIRKLDQRIASEQRSAEAAVQLRRLSYGDDVDE